MRFGHLSKLAVAALAAVALAAVALPCGAQDQFHFEFVPPRGMTRDIPPDGSQWHELYPTMCAMGTQTGYEDNGDGLVSACDYIHIDGISYHITWSGPTYVLKSLELQGRADKFVEPMGFRPDGRSPICEIWHEIWPEYCTDWHVEGWEDNGDLYVSPCDMVFIFNELAGFQEWHVHEVNLNIIAVPEVPVEQSTWGRIKAFVGNLFE